MRGCQHGLRDDSWKSADESRSRTKTKRACDECARAKAKCDYQVPCNRCKRKSVKCEKTRKGYEDPYAMYSVPITAKNVAPSGTTDIMIIPDENVEASSASAAPPVLGCTSLEGGGPEQASFTPQPNDDPSAMMLDSPRSPPRDRSLEALDKTPGTFFADCDFATMDPSEMVLQPDPASLYFASMGTLDQLFHPQDLSKGNPSKRNHKHWIRIPGLILSSLGSDFFAPYQTSTPLTGSGFSLSRLDPLEAKCNELN